MYCVFGPVVYFYVLFEQTYEEYFSDVIPYVVTDDVDYNEWKSMWIKFKCEFREYIILLIYLNFRFYILIM